MYYSQNRINDAISQLKHLLKQDPNSLSVKKLLIMALLKKGDTKTIKEICKTIDKFDQDPIFHDILKSLKEAD